MEKNEELTIEEMEKQYTKMREQCDNLYEQIKQKKQDEADKIKAELALQKESRRKEVDEALKNYNELLKAYLADYGTYYSEEFSDDFAWYPNKFWRSFF